MKYPNPPAFAPPPEVLADPSWFCELCGDEFFGDNGTNDYICDDCQQQLDEDAASSEAPEAES